MLSHRFSLAHCSTSASASSSTISSSSFSMRASVSSVSRRGASADTAAQRGHVAMQAGGFGRSNKKRVETNPGSVYVGTGKKSLVQREEEAEKRDLAEKQQKQLEREQAARTEALRQEQLTTAQPLSEGVGLRGTMPSMDVGTGNWINVEGNIKKFFEEAGKDAKVKTLAAGRSIMLYKFKPTSTVYCSDIESTAYKFPLVDAPLLDVDGAPVVESPLDGSTYDLRTGEVLKWCPPGGNPVQAFARSQKRDKPSAPLAVYATHVKADGALMVRLT